MAVPIVSMTPFVSAGLQEQTEDDGLDGPEDQQGDVAVARKGRESHISLGIYSKMVKSARIGGSGYLAFAPIYRPTELILTRATSCMSLPSCPPQD